MSVVLKLLRKLEGTHMSSRVDRRAVSEPPEMTSTQQGMPRKSSLKDVTAASGDEATGRLSVDNNFAKVAKSVRVQSPHTSDGSIHPTHQEMENDVGDSSMLSNTSRRRQRAASDAGMTSEFILPDITIHTSAKACVAHDTDRPEDVADVTSATIRPAQPPHVALAILIKQTEDEVAHLKMLLNEQQRLYDQHDPSLSKHKRVAVKAQMDKLTARIEKRSDQVYALYDVLEGQKEQALE